MVLEARRATLLEVLPLRALHLREMAAQVRYDAVHARGWSDLYLLASKGAVVGYGAVMGQAPGARDTVFELYVAPPARALAGEAFDALVQASGAALLEAQTNDPSLAPLLRARGRDPEVTALLFADHAPTHHAVPGARVRPRHPADAIFPHAVEPVGDLVVEHGGEVVATGGFFTHYNPPFGDVYMEVREDARRRGFGTLVVQEAKRACAAAGRVPAARCNPANAASRATLLKAGFRECGQLVRARLDGGGPRRGPAADPGRAPP